MARRPTSKSAKKPPEPKRRWWHPRLADPFALLGAAGFFWLLVDRAAFHSAESPTLTSACVVLMMGAPVQRFAERVLDPKR